MAWSSLFGRRVLSATEARQGFRDRPVLVVLVVSLALATLILGIMVLFVWQ
jgi:hypothetical protein